MSTLGGPKITPGKVIGPTFGFAYRIPQSQTNISKVSLHIATKMGICSGFLEAEDPRVSGFVHNIHYELTLHNEPVGQLWIQKFQPKTPLMITHIDIDRSWQRSGLAKFLMNVALSDAVNLGLSLEGLSTNPTIGYKTSLPHTILPLLEKFGMKPSERDLQATIRMLNDHRMTFPDISVEMSEGEMIVPYFNVIPLNGPGGHKIFLKNMDSNKPGKDIERDISIYEDLQFEPETIAELIMNDRAYVGVPYELCPTLTEALTEYALSLPSPIRAPLIPAMAI